MLALSAIILLCGAGTGRAKLEWDEIDEGVLASTSLEYAPEAPAVILFDRGMMTAEFDERSKKPSVEYQKYVRMKILTEKGYDYTTVRIRHREDEKIEDLEARTILPGGQVVELGKDDFLRNEVKTGKGSSLLYETAFTFPALEPGCIVEYKFIKKSENIYFLDSWYFRNQAYTLHSEFTGRVSPLFVYNYYLFPDALIIPDKETEFYHGQTFGKFTWAIDSVAAYTGEPYSPPISLQRGQLSFAISKIRLPGITIPISDSWKSVSRAFFAACKSIQSSGEIRDAAKSCTEGLESRDDKIAAIFNYIKENINYQGGSSQQVWPGEPKKIIQNKYGDGADMAALMVQMLRDVDIEAYPAVISTRYNPPFLRNFPSHTQFTRMLVYIFDAQNPIWVDPASGFADYAVLPWEDQGMVALVINSEDGSFAGTPIREAMENLISHLATLTVNDDGTCSVEGWVIFTGLCREEAARQLDGMTTDDERKEFVRNTVCPDLQDAELEEYSIPDKLRGPEGLRITYRYTSEAYVDLAEDRLMLNPALCHRITAENFESEKRETPVCFKYPYSINVTMKLNLPDGFVAEQPPKPFNTKRPFGQFNRYMDRLDDGIYYHKMFTLPEIWFTPANYQALRQFYQLLETRDEELLVLRKGIPAAVDTTSGSGM